MCNATKVFPTLTNNSSGFSNLHCIKTNDVYGTYLKKFTDYKPELNIEGIAYPDIVFKNDNVLTDKYDKILPGNFVLYNEQYVLKGDVYSKTILVFCQDNTIL